MKLFKDINDFNLLAGVDTLSSEIVDGENVPLENSNEQLQNENVILYNTVEIESDTDSNPDITSEVDSACSVYDSSRSYSSSDYSDTHLEHFAQLELENHSSSDNEGGQYLCDHDDCQEYGFCEVGLCDVCISWKLHLENEMDGHDFYDDLEFFEEDCTCTFNMRERVDSTSINRIDEVVLDDTLYNLKSLTPSDVLFNEQDNVYITNYQELEPTVDTPVDITTKEELFTDLIKNAIEKCATGNARVSIKDLVESIFLNGTVPYEFLEEVADFSGHYDENRTPEMVENLFQSMMEDIDLDDPAQEQSGDCKKTKKKGFFSSFTADVANDVLDEVEDKHGIISELKDLLGGFKNTSDKLNDISIDSILQTIAKSQTVGNVARKATKGLLSLVVFSGSVLLYKFEPTHTNMGLMGLSFCAMLYYTNLLGNVANVFTTMGFLRDLTSDTVKEQATSDFVTTGLSFVMGCYFRRWAKVPDMIYSSIAQIGHTRSGFSDIYDMLIKLVENITNYIRVEFLQMNKIRLVGSSLVEVDFFIENVQKIMDLEDSGRFYKTTDNFLRLQTLRNEGNALLKSIHSNGKTSGALLLARNALANICKLIREFQARNVNADGARQEPVGVCLQGGTGVGKSMTMQNICSAFCAETLDDDQFASFQDNRSNWIFNYQVENGFFDGYQPTTHVTYFDEMFQAVDIAGKPESEAMTLLRMINTFEMALHMAKLETKGNIKFHSKLVIGTTNAVKFKLESIIKPEAVIRRMHVKVLVTPKPEYCLDLNEDYWQRSFDFSKIPDAVTVKHQHFFVCNDEGKAIGEPFEFDELMQRIFKEYEKRKKFHLQNCVAYAETQDEYRQARNERLEKVMPVTQEQGITLAMKNKLATHEFAQDLDMFGTQIDTTVQRIVNWFATLTPKEVERRTRVLTDFMEEIYTIESLETFKFIDLLAIFAEDTGVDALDIIKYDLWEKYVNDEILVVIESHGKMTAELPRISYIKLEREGELNGVSFFDELCSKYDEDGIFESVRYLYAEKPWVMTMLTFGSTLLTSVLIQKIVGFFCPTFENVQEESINHSDKLRTPRAKVDLTKGSAALKASLLAKEQAGEYDSNGMNIAKSVMSTNGYFIYLGDSYFGSVMFIMGRIAVMPMHFMRRILRKCKEDNEFINTIVYLRKAPPDKRVERDVELVCIVKDMIEGMEFSEYSISQDFCFVQFPRQINEKRNIVEYFLQESDLTRFEKNIHFTLMDPSMNQVRGLARERTGLTIEDDQGETRTVTHSYAYLATTGEGSCGSVFYILNPVLAKRKIAGIHIAGHSAGWGFSTVLTQEVIKAHLDMFQTPIVDVVESENVVYEQSADFEHTNLVCIGRSRKQLTQGSKTQIVRSELYNKYGFKPLTRPTKTTKFYRDGELVDPVKLALSKYVYPKKYIDEGELKKASSCYYDFLEHVSEIDVERRLFTWEEALDGLPLDPDVGGINLSTSCGFKMKNEDKDFKKILHGLERGSDAYNEAAKELFAKCDATEAMYLKNVRPFFAYIFCLKDERRDHQRVLEGKTRGFSVCEFEYYMIFMRYFGAFFSWMKKNRISNHCAVGVNPYSEEWTRVTHLLSQFDENAQKAKVGAGDYKHFDGSEQEQILLEILDIINRWYDDDFADVRYIAWQEICNSKYVIPALQVMAEMEGSIPSGNPATTYINCMYNEMGFRLSWQSFGLIPSDFSKFVYVLFYGDDNIFTVHPHFRQIINEITLVKAMEKHGLEYTTELKSTATAPFRNLSDVEFIKRSFVYDPESCLWLAPLRLEVVLEIPCWTTRKGGIDITTDNVSASIRELALHPKPVFDEWTKKLIAAYKTFLPFAGPKDPWCTDHSMMRDRVSGSEFYFP